MVLRCAQPQVRSRSSIGNSTDSSNVVGVRLPFFCYSGLVWSTSWICVEIQDSDLHIFEIISQTQDLDLHILNIVSKIKNLDLHIFEII